MVAQLIKKPQYYCRLSNYQILSKDIILMPPRNHFMSLALKPLKGPKALKLPSLQKYLKYGSLIHNPFKQRSIHMVFW